MLVLQQSFTLFLSCIRNSRSTPLITMVVTNADSNSLISSEVMNWCSFVNQKHYLFLHTLCLFVLTSQCIHGFFFVQCVIYSVLQTHSLMFNLFLIWPRKLLQFGPRVFSGISHQFWSLFLLSGTKRCSWVTCVFLA